MNRFELLDGLRAYARPRQAACRRRRIAHSVQCQRKPDGSIGFAGVMTCGSLWACPVCAVRIYGKRADEVKAAVEQWRARGPTHTLSMATLTVRHARGFELRRLRSGLAKAYRSMFSGERGALLKRRLRIIHAVRSLEVTHSERNGWHPHLHVALFQRGDVDEAVIEDLRAAWERAVTRHLGPGCAPDWTHGVDVRPLEVVGYLTKLGLEVASIASKEGREGSRSAWQIAQDAAAGDERSIELWRGYCRAMKGARQLFWSRGARAEFALGRERTDEELSVDDDSGYVIATWEGVTWDGHARSPCWLATVQAAALDGDEAIKKLPGAVGRPPPGAGLTFARLARLGAVVGAAAPANRLPESHPQAAMGRDQ